MKKFMLLFASVATLVACNPKTEVFTGGEPSPVPSQKDQPTETPTPAPAPAPQTEIHQNPSTSPISAVDALTVQGYKFVLVATKNNADMVLVNEEANNLEFNVGDTVCRTKILTKDDPTFPGEELGVLQVVCDSHGVKLTSSASCSPNYPEVQSHFEIADGQDSYILDLICRVKAP